MLDKWFMNSLSGKGIAWYWVGQLGFYAVLAIVLFAVKGMSMDDGYPYLIGGGIAFLLGWGFTCKTLWPKDEDLPVRN